MHDVHCVPVFTENKLKHPHLITHPMGTVTWDTHIYTTSGVAHLSDNTAVTC